MKKSKQDNWPDNATSYVDIRSTSSPDNCCTRHAIGSLYTASIGDNLLDHNAARNSVLNLTSDDGLLTTATLRLQKRTRQLRGLWQHRLWTLSARLYVQNARRIIRRSARSAAALVRKNQRGHAPGILAIPYSLASLCKRWNAEVQLRPWLDIRTFKKYLSF